MNAAPAPPRLLAFDTSTESLAVAVDDGVAVHGANVPGGAAASQLLLPQLRALVQRAGLELKQIDGIAFGCGPGAFTGLRTACSVAQGLAFGLKRPVMPVDSLLIVAEDARAQAAGTAADAHDGNPFEVTVVMDARMNEIYAGRYRHVEGRWRTVTAPRLVSLAGLLDSWADEGPPAVAGSALAAFDLQRSLAPGVPAFTTEADRAAALLRLARAAHAAGAVVDAAQALPIYLRDKVAQTTAERDQAKAGIKV